MAKGLADCGAAGHSFKICEVYFVGRLLKTGIPWEYLPQEMGCGSGMTCWRRLRDWQKAGVWAEIHRVLLSELRGADQIDFSRAWVDSDSIRAVFGGRRPAPIPRIGANRAPSII